MYRKYKQNMERGAQAALLPWEAEEALIRCRARLGKEIRIAVVGKTGVGKSSLVNTICGEKIFKTSMKSKSTTLRCQTTSTEVQGKNVVLIDTPGIFDSEYEPTEIENEIKRCIHLGAPGLSALLLVMEIGRFKTEDTYAFETFLRFFKEDLLRFGIIVFTHADKLENEECTFEEFLNDAPDSLKTLLRQCNFRKALFNNYLKGDESYEQVSLLLTMVDSLQLANEMKFYSDVVFREAEIRIQQREREIKEELEKEYAIKQINYEKTLKENLQMEIKLKLEEQLLETKNDYDERLATVRKEIRKEIAEEKKCPIS